MGRGCVRRGGAVEGRERRLGGRACKWRKSGRKMAQNGAKAGSGHAPRRGLPAAVGGRRRVVLLAGALGGRRRAAPRVTPVVGGAGAPAARAALRLARPVAPLVAAAVPVIAVGAGVAPGALLRAAHARSRHARAQHSARCRHEARVSAEGAASIIKGAYRGAPSGAVIAGKPARLVAHAAALLTATLRTADSAQSATVRLAGVRVSTTVSVASLKGNLLSARRPRLEISGASNRSYLFVPDSTYPRAAAWRKRAGSCALPRESSGSSTRRAPNRPDPPHPSFLRLRSVPARVERQQRSACPFVKACADVRAQPTVDCWRSKRLQRRSAPRLASARPRKRTALYKIFCHQREVFRSAAEAGRRQPRP